MKPTSEELIDRACIRDVLERYCRGLDRCDADVLQSVYWPDSYDDHGIWDGPGQELAGAIIPYFKEHYVASMHCLGQSHIRVNGLRATAETYCTAMHRAEVDGATTCDLAFFRYVDQLERRGDEWRISERLVLMEHTQTLTQAAEDGLPMTPFSRGTQDATDRSYAMFELLRG